MYFAAAAFWFGAKERWPIGISAVALWMRFWSAAQPLVTRGSTFLPTSSLSNADSDFQEAVVLEEIAACRLSGVSSDHSILIGEGRTCGPTLTGLSCASCQSRSSAIARLFSFAVRWSARVASIFFF